MSHLCRLFELLESALGHLSRWLRRLDEQVFEARIAWKTFYRPTLFYGITFPRMVRFKAWWAA